MKTLRTNLCRTALVAGGLLACAFVSPLFAEPHAFRFWQGPADMIIPMNDFRQFHSYLTNTGTEADSYTLTVTREQPETWLFNVCYEGVCWPAEQSVFLVPTVGTMATGEVMEFDFDITSLFVEGEATYTVHMVSNSDSQVQRTVQFTAKSPTEPRAILLATGEGVIGTTVNSFVSFHPVLYNAGTEPDTYHLTMTRDLPDNWIATFCFDGICYPADLEEIDIPDGPGMIPGAGAVPLDIDFTTLFNEGTGTVVLRITSNTDPSLTALAVFTVTTGSIVAVEPSVPTLLSGVHAAPNPFNPRTEIRFEIGGERSRSVVIDIHDASGRRVQSLGADLLPPGRHQLTWDGFTQLGQPAPAGVYLARVQLGQTQQTIKLSLVK